MRLALKVAYDGTRFSGSQVQPGVRTVHGELAQAARGLGIEAPAISWAGRTDAGVSARANVAVLEADLAPASVMAGLTYRMEDAWAWAWAEVDAAFEPRRARERWYRYHLRSDLDAKRLADAMSSFVGTHDMTSFCRLEPHVTPVRTVRSVDVARRGADLLVDVRGESFLWNQVRRMVEAGRRVAAGELPGDAIVRALREPRAQDLGTAPPEPLVLMDVAYEGLAWREDARMLERLERRIDEADLRLDVLRTLRGA